MNTPRRRPFRVSPVQAQQYRTLEEMLPGAQDTSTGLRPESEFESLLAVPVSGPIPVTVAVPSDANPRAPIHLQ